MTTFCVRVKFQDANRISVLVGKLLEETEEKIIIQTGAGNVVTIYAKFLVSKEQTKTPFIDKTKKEEDEC
ncbi:hypothetical protein KY338_05525 [Candidatus Woesearchaeota archaeon]|nr:hypothetical protein [Candidatus Woesearchaeota archaeon]